MESAWTTTSECQMASWISASLTSLQAQASCSRGSQEVALRPEAARHQVCPTCRHFCVADQLISPLRAKLYSKQRFHEKVQLKKTLKMHEEKKSKKETAPSVPEGAIPAYLMDRADEARAKALSNTIKQKRKEKAVSCRFRFPELADPYTFLWKMERSAAKSQGNGRGRGHEGACVGQAAPQGLEARHHQAYIRRRDVHAETAEV